MSSDAEARERELLAQAQSLRARAPEGEVFATHTETISVGFEKNDLKLTQVDEGRCLGLRALRDGKLGFASTNQGDEAALDAAAAEALELARLSRPDPHHTLPAPQALPEAPALLHPRLAEIGIDAVVERGRELLRRTLAVDSRVSVDSSSLTLARSTSAVCSSAGVAAAESGGALRLTLFGMAVDGDDVGGFDQWSELVRDPSELDPAIETAVARFTSSVLGNLGAGAAESYRGPVLFSPSAFLMAFVRPLVGAASALAVQRGRSALAEKLGSRVASPALHVLDDPTAADLGGAARFDREGQPARPFPIVEGGVLRRFLYNAYAAHVDGCESTGHASGGARSLPGLAPHALVVAPGDGGDVAALAKTLGRGLYIQRFSGTVDPASGDFSGVAKSARWIENGEIARPLRETLLSGNAFELLQRVTALGSESERVMGFARAPAAIVDDVSVTAG